MKRTTALVLLGLACLLTMPSTAHARYRDGLNLYQYVSSSPSRYVDPDGRVRIDIEALKRRTYDDPDIMMEVRFGNGLVLDNPYHVKFDFRPVAFSKRGWIFPWPGDDLIWSQRVEMRIECWRTSYIDHRNFGKPMSEGAVLTGKLVVGEHLDMYEDFGWTLSGPNGFFAYSTHPDTHTPKIRSEHKQFCSCKVHVDVWSYVKRATESVDWGQFAYWGDGHLISLVEQSGEYEYATDADARGKRSKEKMSVMPKSKRGNPRATTLEGPLRWGYSVLFNPKEKAKPKIKDGYGIVGWPYEKRAAVPG